MEGKEEGNKTHGGWTLQVFVVVGAHSLKLRRVILFFCVCVYIIYLCMGLRKEKEKRKICVSGGRSSFIRASKVMEGSSEGKKEEKEKGREREEIWFLNCIF